MSVKTGLNRAMVLAAATVLLCLTQGCSTFERDWRNARTIYPVSPSGLEGRWQGKWQSDVNNHSGRLRAIITHDGGDQYTAHFKATYAFFIPFEFEIPIMVSIEDSQAVFSGQADLGFLAGGQYNYTGQSDGLQIHSNYASRRDNGLFTLYRIPSQCGSDDCDGTDSCPHCIDEE